MKSVSVKQFKNAIDTMLSESYIDGVSYIPLDKTPDGKTIALVIGWQDGYEDGEKWQVKMPTLDGKDLIFTLCGKIAVNIDDLQCDYNFDWYMPTICDGDKLDGDIFDTDMALTGNYESDLEWFMDNAKQIIEDFKLGVLTI
mgnify:CR=1 FL=1